MGSTGETFVAGLAQYGNSIYAGTSANGRIYRSTWGERVTLSAALPAIADVGSLVYVPISLTGVIASDDLRGAQIGLRVSNTAVLTPAGNLPSRMGNLFPTGSLSYTVALSNGYDFMLTATLSPTQAISGSGQIIALPFYARAEGCVDLTFADHLLTNGSAQLISHQVTPGRICVQDKGNLRGTTYLQGRATGHFTGTLVTATGARGTYTTTTDAAGNFTFTDIYSGTYTAYFTHTLFVHALRSVITVTGQTTMTVPEVGLWAGDMNQDGDVDNPDWYVCAAASIPVDDPAFDINDDRATDIRDCTLLGNNIGRPNMPATNPPKTGVAASAQSSHGMAGLNVGRIVGVPLGTGEMLLRAVDVNGQLYATGARLGLPAGATVTGVELRDGFAGGFLRWHQDTDHLYIVAAPREAATLTQNTDVVRLRFTGAGAATIAAASAVGEPKPVHAIYLPVVVRH